MNKNYIVWVCTLRGKGHCWEKGSGLVLEKFRAEVESRGLGNVMVNPIGCTDRHDNGPAVLVDPDDTWYCPVTPKDVIEIIEEHALKGKTVDRLLCSI